MLYESPERTWRYRQPATDTRWNKYMMKAGEPRSSQYELGKTRTNCKKKKKTQGLGVYGLI